MRIDSTGTKNRVAAVAGSIVMTLMTAGLAWLFAAGDLLAKSKVDDLVTFLR